jgi:mannosyltransferase
MRRIADVVLLAAIVVFGAVLRFSGLTIPSLWLDEILDYDVATKLTREPLWRWLTGFASEHGPLFFATELAGRFAHAPGFAARFAPAVFGCAAVVVAAVLTTGARDEGRGERLTFALLLAGSPLAIYYSREARPYALLILLSTLMLAAFLRPSASPRETVLPIAIPFLALFTTSGSGPLLVASALTAIIAFAITRRRFFAIYTIASIIAAASIPLLYRRMPGNTAAAGFRPLSARFFQRLLQSFSIAAIDITIIYRAAYVVAALALIGAIVLLRRDKTRGAIVIGMAVLPIAVSLAALWKLRHWYAVRYVATALPAYLLLVAIGITAILRLILRGRTAIAIPIAAMVVGGLIVREGWTSATTEPYRKLNWRVIAATIHEHAHARDAVVTTNDWSYVCLDFYLRQLPPRVRLISAGESASRAASVVAHNEPVWIVSAGFHRPGDVGDWSCQYPVVLASPLEGFRLHYAPGIRHLLINRFTSADTRALIARYPTHVMHLGRDNDFFLAGGWYGPDGDPAERARWTGAEPVSAMLIASAADHRLLLHMMPFDYGGAHPQIATISLNAAPIARLPLAIGWRDYTFDIPRTHWRAGANFLTIAFSRAEAPSSIDPKSGDSRLLSARLNLIAVTPLGTRASRPLSPVARIAQAGDSLSELTRAFRINEPNELLDENAWWRGRKRSAPAPPSLLARIGIEPSRHLGIDDAAETIAYDSACLNDSDFLHIAYATILGRSIDPAGERYFASVLQKKETRVGVVRALVDSEEFRKLR